MTEGAVRRTRPDGKDPVAIRRAFQQIQHHLNVLDAYDIPHKNGKSIGETLDDHEDRIAALEGP